VSSGASGELRDDAHQLVGLDRLRQVNLKARVLRAHGVRSIVQFGGEPAPIPECDLESMRKLVASGYPVEPWAGLVPGQKVRIDSGPLAGAQGVFVRRKTDCCLAVSIDILGRSVIATLDPEAVFPLMPHDSRS